MSERSVTHASFTLGGGGTEEAAVVRVRAARGTDRPAVDPRRDDSDVEDAVEARVLGFDRPVPHGGRQRRPVGRRLHYGSSRRTS